MVLRGMIIGRLFSLHLDFVSLNYNLHSLISNVVKEVVVVVVVVVPVMEIN